MSQDNHNKDEPSSALLLFSDDTTTTTTTTSINKNASTNNNNNNDNNNNDNDNDNNNNNNNNKFLFGRDEEIQILRKVYEKCVNTSQQQLVLIRGRSGTGKTALANSLRHIVADDGGFFLSGKFELNVVGHIQNSRRCSNTQSPFSVFIDAFTQLTELLQRQQQQQQRLLDQVRKAILEQVGKDEGKLLTDMAPALVGVIGEQEETYCCQVTGKEATQHLRITFRKFYNAVASVAPVVLVLDDLQWSDKVSLELLDSLLLLQATSNRFPLMIIGTFRAGDDDDDDDEATPIIETGGTNEVDVRRDDDEERPLDSKWVDPTTIVDDDDDDDDDEYRSPFKLYLQEKKWLETSSETDNVSVIDLVNLDESSLHDLISATLREPIQNSTTTITTTTKLSNRLHCQSEGNAFYALQLLQVLLNRGIVYRDAVLQQLIFREEDLDETSLEEISSATELVEEQIGLLSGFTQEVLKVAACLGDDIDETALSTVLDGKVIEISSSLKEAMKKDLLSHTAHTGRYRFRHDRIRQATLTMIQDVNSLSFELGYKLWQRSSPHYLYTQIFAICNLLELGIHRVTDRKERYQIAAYYLEAGVKASSLAAFSDASRYAKGGINLLTGDGDYWGEEYDLSLRLFNLAIDSALFTQEFNRVASLVSETLSNARSRRDKVTAYTAMIHAAGQNRSMEEALVIGLDTLKQLGITLTMNPSPSVIGKEIALTRKMLKGRSNYDILSLPPMDDEINLAAMHVLHNLVPYAYQRAPPLVVLIGTKLVQLTMKHGLSKLSSIGFVTFSWILCETARNEGFRLGELSLSLVQKMRAKELLPKVQSTFYFLTSHWTRHLGESLVPLRESYSIGMKIGDLENALYALSFECSHTLFSGARLSIVEEKYYTLINQLKQHKQATALRLILPYLQYVHNLMGHAPDPKVLTGSTFGLDSVDAENMIQLVVRCGLGADLAFHFEDYGLAQDLAAKRKGSNIRNFAAYTYAFFTLNDGLIAASAVRHGNSGSSSSSSSRRRSVTMLRRSLAQMAAWAKDCPHNFLHKQKLLEAELKSVRHHRSVQNGIVTLYDEAIDRALNQGFRQEAARACEMAGNYFKRQASCASAEEYWKRAQTLYDAWGASAKVAHFEIRRSA